jgi:hypothetical protein
MKRRSFLSGVLGVAIATLLAVPQVATAEAPATCIRGFKEFLLAAAAGMDAPFYRESCEAQYQLKHAINEGLDVLLYIKRWRQGHDGCRTCGYTVTMRYYDPYACRQFSWQQDYEDIPHLKSTVAWEDFYSNVGDKESFYISCCAESDFTVAYGYVENDPSGKLVSANCVGHMIYLPSADVVARREAYFKKVKGVEGSYKVSHNLPYDAIV